MRISKLENVRGFTLVEVMAAVAILGIGLVSLMLAVNRAKDSAFVTRNLKAVQHLSLNLMGEIESGKFETLHDGMLGNFSEQGFPEFEYEIGLGEDSSVSSDSEDLRTDSEKQRDERRRYEESQNENSNSTSTEQKETKYEQVTLKVKFKTLADEPVSYVLIKKMPTDIIDGNFQNLTTSPNTDSNGK